MSKKREITHFKHKLIKSKQLFEKCVLSLQQKKICCETSLLFFCEFEEISAYYFSNSSICLAMFSILSVGSKRATTCPFLLMRNLVKFHLMEGFCL